MTSIPPVDGVSSSTPLTEELAETQAKPNSQKEQSKSSIEPAPKSSWTSWITSPFSSKPKEPVKKFSDEPVAELKQLWIEVYQALAELEYEVMQLRARVGAYGAVDPTFSNNRELMQQLGVMRPNVIKAQKHLAEMEQKLEDLRALIEQGRVYFTKVLEIEKMSYEREFFERAIGRIGLEGNIDNPDVVLFLKTCRFKQKEILAQVEQLKANLGACPLLLKA